MWTTRPQECFPTTATAASRGVRDVPISKTLKPYLEKALLNYKKNREGLLFYDHNKKSVITTNQVNSYYKRICKEAGIESDGQHQLRHTFATRCIESGVPPEKKKISWNDDYLKKAYDEYMNNLIEKASSN